MTDANDRHAPSDDFIEYLGRDIRRAARHQRRFAAHSPAPFARRLAKTVGIAASLVASLTVGVVLGASANAASAAMAPESASAFAITPIKNALVTIGCAVTPPLVAGTSSGARRIAVVDLAAPSMRTTQSMAAVHGIRQLGDGRLLVNDGARRQLRLFDAQLATSSLVLDSLPVASRSYASAGLGTIKSSRGAKLLIPFRGDSSLFGPDGPPEENMLVLDGRGQAIRTLAMGATGQPPGFTDSDVFFDQKGRLIYRHSPTASVSPTMVEVPLPPRRADGLNPFTGRGAASGTMRIVVGRADSLPIIRVDVDTRLVDTVAHIMLPPDERPGVNGVGNGGGRLVALFGEDGKATGAKQIINPLATIDDWAVLSDGTIAIVRGHDYHVDWIRPDGTRSASPKLPFDWTTLSDADKQRLIDSTRAHVDSLDALAAAHASARVARKGNDPVLRQWPYEIVHPSKIADAYPAFRSGAAKADADGNLWILPATVESRRGELVYDVVNPAHGLVRRVRLPAGRTIAGFGKGGVVYLTVGDSTGGVAVERTTLPALPPR